MAKETIGLGKWAQSGVPHRGWRCVDYYDTFERIGEDQYETCQMCETVTIRYVHVMEHNEYVEQLECGCVCAENMELDKLAPRHREKKMRGRAARRGKFADRKGWKISARGNPYIKVDGYHIVIAKRFAGYKIGITPPFSEDARWGARQYPTIEAAKLGAFDALEYMKEQTP
jgi:hypothetical protein